MLIYGKQPVQYVLHHHASSVKTLFLAKEIDKKEYARLMRMDIELKRIPPEAAQKLSRNGNHQGFLAEVAEPQARQIREIAQMPFVVVLCGITDVGNIGALMRSAYALGVDGVVVTGLKSLPLEPVMRSSTGVLMDLPFAIEHNLYDVMTELKNGGHTLYGAVMDGEDVRSMRFEPKRALLLGSEGEGLSARAVRRLDRGVTIRMEHDFDSLNVSAAGAILIDRMRDE